MNNVKAWRNCTLGAIKGPRRAMLHFVQLNFIVQTTDSLTLAYGLKIRTSKTSERELSNFGYNEKLTYFTPLLAKYFTSLLSLPNMY